MPTIIPNPPEGGPNGGAPAETFEILLQSLQAFALIHSFCIIKQRASNYRDKKPMRYDIVCDRGQGRPSVSAGPREATTQKVNCPWKGVANALKDNDWEWTFRIRHGEHNHDASSDPSAHAMHRRITPAQQQSLADISRHSSIRAREAGSILRNSFPEAVFDQKDIHNARQRVRLEALDGYTPTQALSVRFENEVSSTMF